jgi:hypothetical protein
MTDIEIEKKLDSLFEGWQRFGVRFTHTEPAAEPMLLERLIAETSIWGRYKPRLMDGMLGWIQKCGDLIDISLMRENLRYGASAVIGLLSDVLTSDAAQNFKQIKQYCTPKTKPEMLFHIGNDFMPLMIKAAYVATEINRIWNLYYVSLLIKTSTLYTRQYILRKCCHTLTQRAYNFGIKD